MHTHKSLARALRLSVLALWMLIALIAFYLLTEPMGQLLGWLPYVVLLICPLLHVFAHGHRRRGPKSDGHDPAEGHDPAIHRR